MFWYPFVLSLLKLSLAGSFVIAVVLVARLLLKKAPRWLSYALWSVVLVRLLVPLSVTSYIGIVPETLTNLPDNAYYSHYEQVTPIAAADAAFRTVGDTLNGGIGTVPVRLTPDTVPDTSAVPAYHRQVWPLLLTALWPIGVFAMTVYALVSYVRLRRKLVGAIKLDGNVYLSDGIPSPFVLGLFRPKIYLPSTLTQKETEYILLHERTHLSRFDHLTRPLAFLALSLHWFNPLVWLAFLLSGRDMEVSCDEAVLAKMGTGIRADYAQSLLNLSTGRVLIAATPLAFGEGSVKDRIQNILRWKKPPVRIVAICLCLVLLLCGCLFTDRASDPMPTPSQEPSVASTPSPISTTPPREIVPFGGTEPTMFDYMDAFLTARLKQDVELHWMSNQFSESASAPLGDITITMYSLDNSGEMLLVLFDFPHYSTASLEIYLFSDWDPETLYSISADSFPETSVLSGFSGELLYTEKSAYYYTEGTRKTYAHGPYALFMETPDTYQFFTEENEVFSPVPITLEQYP